MEFMRVHLGKGNLHTLSDMKCRDFTARGTLKTWPHVVASKLARLSFVGISSLIFAAMVGAQDVRDYAGGWITSVSGDLYYVESTYGDYMHSAYGAQVRRARDSRTATPVAAVWPVGKSLAILVPLLEARAFHVIRFSDGKVLFKTNNRPIALSRDGQTLITTPDKASLYIKRGASTQTIRFKNHVIGVSLSPDGSMGAITFQNGTMKTFTIDKSGVAVLSESKLRYGSPIYGPDWYGPTVAVFGSETNTPTGLASIWLCNVRTGNLRNLGSSTVAVTATSQGFLALNEAGRLDLLNGNGNVIKSYGVIKDLKGFYYELGPKAYDYLPLTVGRLAGGSPTALAFDPTTVYARDQFRRLKSADTPWMHSPAEFAKLVKFP